MFYHLERQPLEKILPQLVARSLERGWRVVVRADSEERVEALSALLWTFSEEAFVPHGSKADGNAALQPVWLTADEENPNQANVGFFVAGAPTDGIDSFQRAVIMFSGDEAEAVSAAREKWKWAKAAGHDVSYWQQDEAGRWQNRASQ
jgi:DNA polymerase-3 subunit chi